MLEFPEGKRFAFTVFDDTDVSTLEYIRPVYDYLTKAGFRTTKSVWPLGYHGRSDYSGSDTLEEGEYADYVCELQSRGFEIGFHGATMESSNRLETERAFAVFNQTLGRYPRTYAAHARNRENLYWGVDRFTSPLVRKFYSFISPSDKGYFQGDVEGSPYFWGDLALRCIDYVRTLTFHTANLMEVSRNIVYREPHKSWINNCFITSDADNVEEFNRLLGLRNQDRLERQGGVCIVSTHFGKGFTKHGRLHPDCKTVLDELAARQGWFVPVAQLLDYLTTVQTPRCIGRTAARRLEYRWLRDVVLKRLRRLSYEKTEVEYLHSASKGI